VLLAGCGGSRPRLERPDAASLIALAHRIPGENACAQARDIRALHRRAIDLVNAGRIPSELQEPLLSGAAALAEQTPVCLAAVPASAPPAPAPSPTRPTSRRHPQRGKEHPKPPRGHGGGHGHDDRHGKGKR
jgi:hypothetical protein